MTDKDLDKLLERMREVVHESTISSELSTAEVEDLRNLIRAYELIVSWGKLGRILIWAAMTLAGLMMAYEQYKAFGEK